MTLFDEEFKVQMRQHKQKPRNTYTCPTCGHDDINVNGFTDSYQLRCKRCGREYSRKEVKE